MSMKTLSYLYLNKTIFLFTECSYEGRMTHICANKQDNLFSDNDSPPLGAKPLPEPMVIVC